MVITNQGVAIQPCFQQTKYMQFYKTGQQVVFIKTGSKHASKGGIELAVFEAFRELLLAVRVFWLRLAVLLNKLLDEFSLVHTGIYSAHEQTHNKEKEMKVLSLSSNQEKFRYEDMRNIFGRFSNGMAEIILGMAW